MHTEKGAMRTEAIFSDDKQHRYLLRKEWDSKKSKATIIMTNPSTADVLIMDYTTLYILNNLAKLDFGSVDIVNMVSKTTTKLDTKEDLTSLTSEVNMKQILHSAGKSDNVIIAWGKLGENNKKVRFVQEQLLEKLKPFQDKLYMIAGDNGELGFHPLAPQIRFTWHLVRFEIPNKKEDNPESKNKEVSQNKDSEASESDVLTEYKSNQRTA